MALRRLTLTRENAPELVAQLRQQVGEDEGLRYRVEEIINRVREKGDEALVAYTRQFDCQDFRLDRLRVPASEIEAATQMAAGPLLDSLKLAAENVRLFHQHEMRGNWTAPMRQNQMLGQRMIPVDRAGLYIPGGAASYPSTVVMTAVPAQVAGVKEIFICSPPGEDGCVSQAVLAAAGMLGINEIYAVGGAQAIAAMAFGTRTIRPADVICGPGNVYVTEAKRQVFGRAGLDSLAGPSEVLIIADNSAAPGLIAADLLAQVEHGSGAVAILVCWSEVLADQVEAEMFELARELAIDMELTSRITLILVKSKQLEQTAGKQGEGASIAPLAVKQVATGADTGTDPLEIAVYFSNLFAPEHLQIHTEQPEQVVHEITCAGAVFLGEDVCTAYGDYIIGSNHVLPTAGTARFGSALSVENFLRKVAVISLIPETILQLTPALVEIARAEGLSAHARAAELRLEKFGRLKDDEGE